MEKNPSEKIKIIHIHEYYAFINAPVSFINDDFENTIAIIENEQPYEGLLPEETFHFSKDYDSLNQLVLVCSKVNIVVLHGFTASMAYVVHKLPSETKIIWRFFGYELYKLLHKLTFSDLTYPLIKRGIKKPLYTRIIHHLKKHLYYPKDINNSFPTDVVSFFDRFSFFLCLCEQEYHFLKNHFLNIPAFLQNPMRSDPIALLSKIEKKNIVVLGHSRSAWNNHLDLIKNIKESQLPDKLEFHLLFNYGKKDLYTKAVEESIENELRFKLVRDFIPKNQFVNYYVDKAIFVLNSYRQIGMGNVFLAIKSGCKIYLNPRNVIYHYFLKNDFLIFDTKDFVSDLSNNEIFLSLEQANHNIACLNRLKSIYTKHEFQKALQSLVAG